jgi:hypothetical protein
MNEARLNLENKNKLLKKELSLKIRSKEDNIESMRNIFLTRVNNNPDATPILPQFSCIDCKKPISVISHCGYCTSVLCQDCGSPCPNKKDKHENNFYCKACVTITCVLCRIPKCCKFCVKKCFYKECDQVFCDNCYEKNKHQTRNETTNCRFYKCDSCNTDTNCILTTIYCTPCDKRICKNCYFNKHQHK